MSVLNINYLAACVRVVDGDMGHGNCYMYMIGIRV